VDYRAFELHPGIPPEGTAIPWGPEQRAAGHANFTRLADSAGLPHGERTHWYNSDLAHEATEWARAQGGEEPFRAAIYHAYFVHNQNIGAPAVLVDIAITLGMDGDDLRFALAERRYQASVVEQYAEAREIGVTAVPTFIAGNYMVEGAQPYSVFEQLIAAAQQQEDGDESEGTAPAG
jgi:predicted DsbA family dithiol-disulfide isomerase